MLRPAHPTLFLALLVTACGTASGGSLSLTIASEPTAATVHSSAGEVLGTTPWTERVAVREYREYVLTAPGFDTVLVTIGPPGHPDARRLHTHTVAWAAGEHAGRTVVPVQLVPSPPRVGEDSLSDAEVAVVFAAFADAAVRAGCEPLLADVWRDVALLLSRGEPPPSGADSIRGAAGRELAREEPRLRELCARRTPRIDRLREIRLRTSEPVEPEGASPFAAVHFAPGSYAVPDSVRPRLRELGRALAAGPMAVVLVVEGFTDGSETERLRELGFQRARSVIAELRAAGLAADCCVLTSGGVAADAEMDGGRWSRRATFALDYRGGGR